jgi:xanthine dehydrogenase iron-sulfur cluster and FAD-binding subunit A
VRTVDEGLALLAQYQGNARVLAGGTDLLIELERKQRPHPQRIIDISRVDVAEGLADISHDGQTLRLGAMVTHNDVVGSSLLRQRALPLVLACWEVGAPQIRNRATIAGNLITASPANDTIVPLWAMGARVVLRSQNGTRRLSFPEFYKGLRKTDLRPDEMLTSIEMPALQSDQRGVFLKLGLRKAQAISVINVCVIVRVSAEGIINEATITMGSVAPTIINLSSVEQVLLGKPLTDEAIAAAAALAEGAINPINDVRSTADYRRAMARVIVARALRAIRDGQEAAALPENPAMLWGDQHGHGALLHHSQHDHEATIEAVINGKLTPLPQVTHKTLLRALREDAYLPGTKEGCAEGECGACTVFLDGAAVMACMVPAVRAHNAEVVTVEGLAKNGALHPIQQGFVEMGAVQCGYCTPGFLMAGAKLLEEVPHPTREQAEQSITGNLCRCTGYYKILEAFERASKALP